MSDTENETKGKRGRQAIETPKLGAFSAADAARAALEKPEKDDEDAPSKEFNKETFVEKIMRAVATDAQSKNPDLVIHIKWPRTANGHKDELFAEFEAGGYKLSLVETVLGTALCVDYRPAE